MGTRGRHQILEHQLECNLNLIALTIFIEGSEKRDINIADEAEIAEAVALSVKILPNLKFGGD